MPVLNASAPTAFARRALIPRWKKLTASNEYTVLLHKAWQQNLGEEASKVAISEGTEQFGQFPIEGTLSLKLGRFTDVDADFWVNQIDANGLVTASERLKQESHTKNGQLNFLDNGHLGLLIKITSLTAPAPRPAPRCNSGLIEALMSSATLSKPLATSWVSRFKEQSLERGRRYALENRVRIVEVGDATITASCEGSGGNVYRQTIRLRESAKGTLLMIDATCTCPVHTNCKHCAAVLLQVQETLAYPAAAKDAELLEKNFRPYWKNRSPKAPPQVLVDNVQPVPRLWLASIEFSAFEPRNGKMQRYIQHRAALSFSYLDEYVSGQKKTLTS